ncbi:MAG: peptide deformylase [Candidatus Levybacteria bacterium]|nr:peptide deformylase [Candidatus Levybacteria bacterium]
MLKIVIAPNPILFHIAKPVFRVDAPVIKTVEEMKKTLLETDDPKGVGLAAPQVGKPLRIFLAKPTDNSKILVFINPKITANEKQLTTNSKKLEVRSQKLEVSNQKSKGSKKLEGCLSLPNIWGPVLRTQSLTLAFLDEKGNKHTKIFNGFMATIIQHEMDHLEGILFPKRVLEQKGTLYKSHKNKKGEDEFEEIEI